MLRAIIIDDQVESLHAVAAQVKENCPNVEVVAQCDGALEGLKAIRSLNPDLVLLDIEMPGMTGLEMIEQIPDFRFGLIFITAYNEFAVRAFKLSAMDYLLKPIEPDELKRAVDKVEQKTARDKTLEQFQMMVSLLNSNMGRNGNGRDNQRYKITLPIEEKIMFVPMEQILWIEAAQNYCIFHFADGANQLISRNIGTYDNSLEPNGFMRVHRSHIVNLYHVKEYLRQDGGSLKLVNGKLLEISRNKRDAVLERLKDL
ncbi:MAG TPA: LytTR family DNA-binding domain-containing protein [Flavilitoribacter sp.]|nr:LytTR family DNA-binding domain-containing protein [Flavilitoribacter sp.]HMQ86247.1 LytTR family DNA-binding domain-containing protein [Flavilitoribacter sp.]